METGWRTGNGAAFREWACQWWFDASAKALGQNYRGFTRPLGIAGKLRDLDFINLSAGDLAVTADGRHVMVYYGNGRWIQADPGPWKVAIGKPAVDRNPWFDSYVTMHRWTVFECPSSLLRSAASRPFSRQP
jgi:cell wall-associated NlpC family hydrolase